MAQGAVIHVAPEQPTHAVCVVGTATPLDVFGSAPKGCTTFGITASPGVVVDVAHSPPAKKSITGVSKWPLDPQLEVTLQVKAASSSTDDQKVRISYYVPKASPIQALLYLTGVEISLSTDVTRTGKAGKAKPARAGKDQSTWTWGPCGQGAILLVNCDKENPTSSRMDFEDDMVLDNKDLQDMSPMTLSTKTPKDFFAKYQLVLHVAKNKMNKVRVFRVTRGKLPSRYKVVLGPQQFSHRLELPGGQHSTNFYVEGLAFPDADFQGLIPLTVSLLDISNPDLPEALVFQDSVTFRVAPWIMTPNTQPPQEVYVCRISENEDFLNSLTALTKKAKCKLTVCPEEENLDDQWMQDEMEIGYIQAPHKTLPVVFDSPRDRGLKDFPIKRVMGPNFGYVTRGPYTAEVTGLDAFGNLEVSPPVTVRGKEYPLGRILIGSSGYSSSESRDMHQALQDFLCAQQVQAPVRLFSDWLFVGHIDEFLSFVPAPDRQSFRLLMSSPRACYQLLQEQQSQGHGEVPLFEGIPRRNQTINDILSNKKLRDQNAYVESCIDWNRVVLKQELGLAEGDIIDIPQLFKLVGNSRGNPKAEAFFPNMVNMLVLGKHLGIPKPFGPIINGHCCLEEKVRSLLEPLGLHCTFINDFYAYHVYHGEVHCGTNVRRKPFAFKWWHMVP
ncbi:protein-arginine deiminase type-4 [Alexandromys fortis]|uniref:protein-arginine deiminase type-4 n=1 Tax=Alexandromys fortis TaxID=100897 RepID=UPI00215342AA|nr:protein-arginine deiminase type-4 [Microtus fortis]